MNTTGKSSPAREFLLPPFRHDARGRQGINVQSLLFAVLSTVDGMFTYYAVNMGYHEDNPFMSPIAASPVYPMLKFFAAAAGLIIIDRMVSRYPQFKTLANVILFLVCVLYTGILARNFAAL